MPTQDTSDIKEKILLVIKRGGPSLPVHVARETNLSMLFAAAFLSELHSENKIKISRMKVGGSPVYFIPGQEHHVDGQQSRRPRRGGQHDPPSLSVLHLQCGRRDHH